MVIPLLQQFAQEACKVNEFLGIPPWYKYLVASGRMVVDPNTHVCELQGVFRWQNGGDVILIALGVLDIALRLGGLVAVGFVVYGGIQYVTSDGSPDQTKAAQQTIINALVGLVIALVATTAVSFIGRTISH